MYIEGEAIAPTSLIAPHAAALLFAGADLVTGGFDLPSRDGYTGTLTGALF